MKCSNCNQLRSNECTELKCGICCDDIDCVRHNQNQHTNKHKIKKNIDDLDKIYMDDESSSNSLSDGESSSNSLSDGESSSNSLSDDKSSSSSSSDEELDNECECKCHKTKKSDTIECEICDLTIINLQKL